MQSLPPNVLHLIATLPDQQLDDPFNSGRLHRQAAGALEYLTPWHDSLHARSIAVAHHIMHGTGSALRLTRYCASIFSELRRQRRGTSERRPQRDWRALEKPEPLQHLDAVLTLLRGPAETTNDRLEHIAELWGLIGCTPGAAHITATLYTHLFCWPLFVFPVQGEETSIALPVAVDTVIARRDRSRRSVIVSGNSAFRLDAQGGDKKTWHYHFQRAREAAILLWLRAHGNCGAEFKETIRTHTTSYDFTWASTIATGALNASDSNRLPLSGGSAAAYFSQVILARLLGKQWYLSSAITGLIGDRVIGVDGEEDRDFWFDAPGSVAAKVRFVLETRTFERIVLPKASDSLEDNDKELATQLAGEGGTEVVRAAKLSNVADIVQIDGWRKTTFIRCPDIAWKLFGRHGPEAMSVEDSAMERVLEQVASSKPILRLDDADPSTVASALKYINERIHEDNQPKSPPGISWSVIRCIDEEQDAALWRTLWRVIGASLSEYELFRDSPTKEIAATRLAEALNQFAPTDQRQSHRAPDVIVIVGADRFEATAARIMTPLAHPTSFNVLMNEFERTRSLRVSGDRVTPAVNQYLGAARIILVNGKPAPVQGISIRSEYDRRVLSALATFRFDFSQQMASLLLAECGIHCSNVRQALSDMAARGFLREVMGRYHVIGSLRSGLAFNLETEADVQANSHWAAGVALAPYIVSAPVPSLAYDVAFLPENIIEAAFHLSEANRLYARLGMQSERNKVDVALRQLCRFAMLPHWGVVDRLNRARHGREAYILAKELMDGWRNHPDNRTELPPHPIHFVEAIEALGNWIPQENRVDEVLKLIGEGLAACRAYRGEEVFNELQLLSVAAVFLYKYSSQAAEKIQDIDRRIWELRPQWTCIRGDWFEKNGDSESKHDLATEHYALGTKQAPEFYQNWIKAVGAARLASLECSAMHLRLSELPTPQRVKLMSWARSTRATSQDRSPEWVRKRWQSALPVLDRLIGG